jgi:hypothetical protein
MSRLAACLVLYGAALAAQPKPAAQVQPVTVNCQHATQQPEPWWWQLFKGTIPVATGAALAVFGVWLTNRHNTTMNTAAHQHISDENQRTRTQETLLHVKDKQREYQIQAIENQLSILDTLIGTQLLLILNDTSAAPVEKDPRSFLTQHTLALMHSIQRVRLSQAPHAISVNFRYKPDFLKHLSLPERTTQYTTWRNDLVSAAYEDLWESTSQTSLEHQTHGVE